MASYPDPWVDDGKVWCYYNVTTTGSATSLLYSTNNIASMEVDGVSATVAKTYTFSTEGEHLVKYTLSNTTTFGVTNSGDYAAFRNVTTIKRCYIPDTVKTIGNYQFNRATNIEFVRFPAQLETIGQAAFQNCSNLVIKALYLPFLSSIGSGCFENCGKIVKINNLGVISTLPNSAIRSMGALTDLILPSTLTSLADASIISCRALKRVVCYAATPPSKYSNVFSGSTLTYIKVPPASVDAYKTATNWSSYSSKIYPLWEEAPIAINHLSLGDFRRRIMIGISTPNRLYPDPWVDDGYIWAYYNVTDTSAATPLFYSSYTNLSAFGANFIVDGVETPAALSYQFATTGEHLVKMQSADGTIKDNCFRGVDALKRLYLPDTITSLGSYSISYNSGLTHLWLSEELTYIGFAALRDNTVLEVINLYLPKLTTLGYSSNNCQTFTYSYMPRGIVNFPSLQSMPRQAVFNETSIKEVRSLGSITELYRTNGGGDFQNCRSLKKVILPETLTTVGAYSFGGCSSLTEINLPKAITSIGRDAFRGTLITNVIDLPNLTGGLNGSFYGSHITEIKDIGSVTSLQGTSGAGGFRNCTHLTKAVIPATMTNMTNGFNGCSSLEEVTIYATTPPTYSGTFNACSSLAHIYVPAESVETYKAASGWSSFANIIEAIPTT